MFIHKNQLHRLTRLIIILSINYQPSICGKTPAMFGGAFSAPASRPSTMCQGSPIRASHQRRHRLCNDFEPLPGGPHRNRLPRSGRAFRDAWRWTEHYAALVLFGTWHSGSRRSYLAVLQPSQWPRRFTAATRHPMLPTLLCGNHRGRQATLLMLSHCGWGQWQRGCSWQPLLSSTSNPWALLQARTSLRGQVAGRHGRWSGTLDRNCCHVDGNGCVCLELHGSSSCRLIAWKDPALTIQRSWTRINQHQPLSTNVNHHKLHATMIIHSQQLSIIWNWYPSLAIASHHQPYPQHQQCSALTCDCLPALTTIFQHQPRSTLISQP